MWKRDQSVTRDDDPGRSEKLTRIRLVLETLGKRAVVLFADSIQWDVYEQNLLVEYNLRYGGRGGVGYCHVSDKYIALFSRFIPCGVWEGTYILDGLMNNASDIQPDIVHADTHGQSTTIFDLAHLLGIKFMPRLRNW